MKGRNARGAKQSKWLSSDQNPPSSSDSTGIEEDPITAKHRWIDRHRDLIRSLEAAGHSLTFSVQPDRSETTGANYGYRTEMWCTGCHTRYRGPRNHGGLSPERPCIRLMVRCLRARQTGSCPTRGSDSKRRIAVSSTRCRPLDTSRRCGCPGRRGKEAEPGCY
jgi:hypothetical protein